MVISEEQKQLIREYVPEASQFVESGDFDALLDKIDEAIMKVGYDSEDEMIDIGYQLERLYDEVLAKNK